MENDFLTDMVNREQDTYDKAKQEGQVEGHKKAQQNSFNEGFKNGFEIWGEVQYFANWAQTLQEMLNLSLEQESVKIEPKNVKIKLAVKELQKIIDTAKIWEDIINPKSEVLKKGIETIHKSMNKARSMLGLVSTKKESIMEW